MRLKAKIGNQLVRGRTLDGRLFIDGKEVDCLPDLFAQPCMVTFASHVPRHERRLLFNRICALIAVAALHKLERGWWPEWFRVRSSNEPAIVQGMRFDADFINDQLEALGYARNDRDDA